MDLVILGTGPMQGEVRDAAAQVPTLHYVEPAEHRLVPGFLRAATVGIDLAADPHTCKFIEYAAAGLPVIKESVDADLPEGPAYVDPDWESLVAGVERARHTDAMADYARMRDFEIVAHDYERALEAAL